MLLELLIVIGLSALLLPVIFFSLLSTRDGKVRLEENSQAVTILKETEEAVRGIKNTGWSNLPASGTYYPEVSGSQWALIPGSSTSGNFTKQVVISDVRRDPTSGEIVSSGGYVDPSTKKFNLTVSWVEPHSSSINSSFYLTRNDNLSRVGGLSDFLLGEHVQTLATTSAGGALTLDYNTKGQWCSPAFSSATIDLPDGPPVAIAASAAATTSVPNDIFVATAPNLASSVKLAYINTTANTVDPVASLRGIFTLDQSRYSDISHFPSGIGLDNSFITNNVKMYTSSSGKLYALLTTSLPDKEVIAILINDNDLYNDFTNDGEFQDYEADPKIYKYWTYFNTKLYADAVTSNNTGTRNPQNDYADAGGDNDGYDDYPNRAYSNNYEYAEDDDSGTNNSTDYTNSGKDRHVYYGYNLSLPSDAEITGVEIRVDARVRHNSCASTKRIYAELSSDNGASWTSADYANIDGSFDDYYLGGSTDLWGRTWSASDFSSPDFRVRLTNVASDTDCDFRLDWAAVRVYYSAESNDYAPFNYGATSLSITDDKGYITSGGYLYAFDLSNIDDKSASSGLDQLGCRIELDASDCDPDNNRYGKYSSTATNDGHSLSSTYSNCEDGGNTERYASNAIYTVKTTTGTPTGTFAFIAVGYMTNPELDIVDVTNPPTTNLSSSSCGRSTSGWRKISDYDFDAESYTQEASNSIFVNEDGTRAYMSSNGGIDANHDNDEDSEQFYIIDTTDKYNPSFLSGTPYSPSYGPLSGFYYGNSPNDELFPRMSLTVLNGERAIVVGKKDPHSSGDPQEYQVLNIENENAAVGASAYCGGLDFDDGFNDLTGISEADGDKFVYMISNSGTNELKIIQGGPDGTYVEWGNYTSPAIDIGYSTIFNRFNAIIESPADTSIDFQFAIASPSAGQSCADVDYDFTGPTGGTSEHYTSTSSALWVGNSGNYQNPGRCIRYKTYMSTTEYNSTPELKSMIINYAP